MPGLRDGLGDARRGQLRRVVLNPKALANHVGVEHLEPGQRFQAVLEDRDLFMTVHPLDPEDRLGVQFANRTVSHSRFVTSLYRYSSTCVSACLSSSMMWWSSSA